MKQKLKNFNIIIASTALIMASCGNSEQYVKTEGMIWNTIYHITYKGPASLQDSILPVLNEVGHSLSVFEESSLVSQLNRNDSVKGDRHLLSVYAASKKINQTSNGTFDPTVSPLVDAWGFGKGHKATADTIALDSIMEFVGFCKTQQRGEFIVKNDPRIQFNFSAIAKGYGSDAVGEMFKRNGVTDYMVEIGGEIAMMGKSPSSSPWKIAIDAPVEGKNPGEETAMILSLTDCGLATSGNYRNYREEREGKVAHTISPVTGRPFIGEILSATVIASTCMEADALATACMASSPENAKKLLNKTGTEGLLIFSDSIWTSPGLDKYIADPE